MQWCPASTFMYVRAKPRAAKGAYRHSVEKYSSFLKCAYITISFSKQCFSGLLRGSGPPSPVVLAVQRDSLQQCNDICSPRS